MNVKGIAVSATYNYIKKNFPEDLTEWLNNLSPASQKIFKNIILPSEWYPAYEAVVEPTQLVGEMFIGSAEKAAFEIGKYSAQEGLKGVYRVFARLSSINYIIKRSIPIYANYYDTGQFSIITNEKGNAVLKLSGVPKKFYLVIHRVAGWIFEIPFILNKTVKKVEFKKLLLNDLVDTYFYLEWED